MYHVEKSFFSNDAIELETIAKSQNETFSILVQNSMGNGL